MADNKAKSSMHTDTSRRGSGRQPEWAKGLRQLYDSVVDEPLPDSFADLIAKLDSGTK
ncbi:MAG TPA: NepR family anti-sigma factor [Novosphingobium sp.]|nr:NepR family anti-sigma factor [Novosphingobium sp.]